MNLGIAHIKRVRNSMRQNQSQANTRSVYITGATASFSVLLGVGKILSGVFSLSIFACMNGFYTLGMALARYSALMGFLQTKEKNKSWFYYKLSGVILIVASLLYISYSLWTIWHPKLVYYGEVIAITIATITFSELSLNLYGVLKNRKTATPIFHSLKIINLASSLIAMVLTQSAILAFADDVQNPSVNGLLGSIMGGIAAVLGIYLICRIQQMEREKKQAIIDDVF